jgi:CPA2 family monovalent cation:H+ antiporter-2
MQHLPTLIFDLALILGSAAVISIVFKFLNQPVVLGYLLAGLLVGPNFHLFPTVAEVEGIQVWAELGVIFLLFGLGLEFSFKKLIKIGGIAGITALIEVTLTMLSGYLLGRAIGWQEMDCLFFGGVLAIASTTIIIRSFEELGVKNQNFAGLVTGILIIEDLVAVILMVVLSTVSISRSFEGIEMAVSILKLSFFLVLWFVSGIYFLPSILKVSKRFLTEETLLIVSVALCFLMVVLAHKAGFSPALGAFIMGSILAETNKAEKIEHLIKPIKNIFGAVFFVSVGMLIDLGTIYEYYIPILLGSLILLFAKPFFVVVGALLTGQTLKISIQTGMSLSQIGEFSFIIASLGLSLNVISSHLYPIAVAISVITTFTTPFMIRLSNPSYSFIERNLPNRWTKALDNYSANTLKATEVKEWKKYIRSNAVNIAVYTVIIISMILLSTRYITVALPQNEWNRIITTILTILLISPFLWALIFRRERPKGVNKNAMKPSLRRPLLVIRYFRIALALFLLGFLFESIYSTGIAVLGVLASCVLLVIFNVRLKHYYYRIESHFITNLNSREAERAEVKTLTPWDSHMTTIELSSLLPFIGKPLKEIKLREKFGINIASIKRGELIINVPSQNEMLYPNDIVSFIGTDLQLTDFKNYIEDKISNAGVNENPHEVSLHHFTIDDGCYLLGKSIRESGIRESTKGLVVGVERNEERILNPESNFIFNLNDTVWMVADEKRMGIFLEAF